MKPVAFRQDVSSRANWVSSSGYSDDAVTISKPITYARHLASYIRDDSRVLSLVAHRFGRSDLVRAEDLAGIRSEIQRDRSWWAMVADVGEPTDADGVPFKVTGVGDLRRPRRIQSRLGRPPMQPMAGDPMDVIRSVEQFLGLPRGAVIGLRRSKDHVRGRVLAAALLRARGNSYSRIGMLMSRRNHTSIQYLIETFFDRMPRDAELADGWRRMAPCITRAARTLAELTIMKRRRL